MDSDQIGELYERFGPVIFRRCQKLLFDPESARDAAQEVFVRAMRHREKLVSDRECLPWLYRVSTNYCLNVIREQRKVRRVPLTVLKDEAGAIALGETLETRIAARQKIEDLLDQLGEVDAQILIFAHMDRMTQDEIAAATGLSRRTVGKRLKQIASATDVFARKERER